MAKWSTLRNTASSVNVKERLDYSCAVFRDDGKLVAGAMHVPVHLGAMGHTVRSLMAAYPEMFEGDCYVSNDPYAGGSHLPDVTVVTPTASGDFRIVCNEFCGVGHHLMLGKVLVTNEDGTMPGEAVQAMEAN